MWKFRRTWPSRRRHGAGTCTLYTPLTKDSLLSFDVKLITTCMPISLVCPLLVVFIIWHAFVHNLCCLLSSPPPQPPNCESSSSSCCLSHTTWSSPSPGIGWMTTTGHHGLSSSTVWPALSWSSSPCGGSSTETGGMYWPVFHIYTFMYNTLGNKSEITLCFLLVSNSVLN